MDIQFQSAFRICLFCFIIFGGYLFSIPETPEATTPSKTIEHHFDEPFPIDENAIASKEDPEEHFYADVLKMLMSLGMLVGLMFFVSWFVKSMMKNRVQQLNQTALIKVLEQRQLSAKSMVHLVEIGDKTYALGESATNLTFLTEVDSEFEQ